MRVPALFVIPVLFSNPWSTLMPPQQGSVSKSSARFLQRHYFASRVASRAQLGACDGFAFMEAITNYPRPLCTSANGRRSGTFQRTPTTPTSQDIKLPRGIPWTKGVSAFISSSTFKRASCLAVEDFVVSRSNRLWSSQVRFLDVRDCWRLSVTYYPGVRPPFERSSALRRRCVDVSEHVCQPSRGIVRNIIWGFEAERVSRGYV